MLRHIFLFVFLFLAGCASTPSFRKDNDNVTDLHSWYSENAEAGFSDSCRPYHQHPNQKVWGEVIGCQSAEVVDVRYRPTAQAFSDKLRLEQGCAHGVKGAADRPFVVNRRSLMYIDKENDNVWFVPEDYVTDGVSFPEIVRLIPGPIFDAVVPKTLPASMVHDRYLCLTDYVAGRSTYDQKSAAPSSSTWVDSSPSREFKNYRRKECTNNAFRNALRTSGSSNIISGIFRSAVGIANGGKEGYCPLQQVRQVQSLEYALEDAKFRTHFEGLDCVREEPLALCLSRGRNLFALSSLGSEKLAQSPWRPTVDALLCLEAQATFGAPAIPSSGDASPYSYPEGVIDFCRDRFGIAIGDSTRAFRAGDVIIEGSPMLQTDDGRGQFITMVRASADINELILFLISQNASSFTR